MSTASSSRDERKAVDWQAIVAAARARLEREGREYAGMIESELGELLELSASASLEEVANRACGQGAAALAEPWLFLGQLRELQGSQEKLHAAVEAYAKSQTLARGRSARHERLAAMNRGNALSKLGQAEAALVAYDEALGVRMEREFESPADWLTLGALHLNRGAALETISTADPERAAESYIQSMEALRRACLVAEESSADFRQAHYLLAGTRLNLAVNLVARDDAQMGAALAVVQEVSDTVAGKTLVELSAADFALRAWRLICEICARQIAESKNRGEGELATWLSRATDAAEEALRLAAHWEKKGEVVFRSAVSWFLAFAAALYTHHQPHFLGEFLTEMLRGELTPPAWRNSRELEQVALSAIDAAQIGVRSWLFQDPTSTEAQQQLATLESLRRSQTIIQNS